MGNTPQKFSFKKDRYSKSRGGKSQFFDIFCATCKNHILLYQKDGAGQLLRMYLDRIFAPDNLSKLQYSINTKDGLENLACPNCKSIIAVAMVYEAENRLAFRMIKGKFSKKKSQGEYPPPQK